MIKRFPRLVFTLLLIVFSQSIVKSQIFNEELYKFGRALGYINTFYIDSVDKSTLVEKAIVEMLQELDPHSVYISKEEVEEMNAPLQGNFDGIGIQFNVLNDSIYVINPITGGPSEKVGIRTGDRIVEIEGENVAGIGITSQGVRSRLLGEKGTKVKVKVKRKHASELLAFTITRDKIPIYSLDAAYIVKDGIGYMKFNNFSLTTVDEYKEAFARLKKENKLKSVIIDLRNNGGGYMDPAIELADQFFTANKLIVYSEGLKVPKSEHFSTSKGVSIDQNVVVLVDEGSASASEIFAGAVQDWDRGIVIGRRSFGKGLVQRPLPLPDGSMMRLTIARYHTPTGRVVQKSYDKGNKDYAEELMKRYLEGELYNKDSIDFPDSLKYYTLDKKRLVYGGGGIMPDIFIPLDTTSYSPYYATLIRRGIVNSFILTYIDRNRKELNKKYPDFETYNKKFVVTDDFVKMLAEHGEKEGVEINEKEMLESRRDIELFLKGLIARDLWDMSEYFEVVNSRDEAIKKAVEVLEDWDKYISELL